MKHYSTITEQARKLAIRATKNHNPSRAQFKAIMQEFAVRILDRHAVKFPSKG
jgi:hypothetical protein